MRIIVVVKRSLSTLLFFITLFFILNFLYPLDTARLNKPKSTLIYDNNNHLIAVKLSADGYLRIPIKSKELNSEITNTLLAYEDQYFYQHFGINPFSIVRAVWSNIINAHKIGASTITMQVARMMHHEKRTIGQKLIEIFQSLQLEMNYTKKEILTFYLNNAPYGGNVEGFASASFRYFNLPPTSLSLSQIAYLTSIPKNPNANRPKKDRNISHIKNKLLKRIYDLNLLNKTSYLRAKKEHIYASISNLPNKIPHLSALIKKEGDVHTTIDLTLQKKVESLLQEEVKKVNKYGIYNAAALVVENHTMNIVSYVGSNNFYDKQHGGENNGIKAIHSPGSTLKPLVYAKALEQGLITPLKKIYDVPLFINGYKPTNYAKEYMGEVSATEALQLSLNIPAVELDRLLQKKSLYTLLEKANISSLTHKKYYYGSSLVLGGWGISLQENSQLFAMLANGGHYKKASFLTHRKKQKTEQILSPQSSYIVSNILADAPRVNFSSSWEYMRSMQKIAFKTGTSAHAKDMLTIGYTPKYTVAIWFGNFSGQASHTYKHQYATGLKVASPTLFKIFNLINKGAWFTQPKGIEKKEICQDAIKLTDCQAPIKDTIISNVTLHTPCSAMRGEVLAYLLKTNKIESFSQLSTHQCYTEWQNYKPLITSPIHEKSYTHNRLLPKEFKKTKLECYSFEENQTIYWLIDNHEPIIGKSSEALYTYLSPEAHHISCLDEGAKMQSIDIVLKEL